MGRARCGGSKRESREINMLKFKFLYQQEAKPQREKKSGRQKVLQAWEGKNNRFTLFKIWANIVERIFLTEEISACKDLAIKDTFAL